MAAEGASDLALDMKRRNVIDIIERFRTEHALQEEREMKNLPASPNGAVISGAHDKNGILPTTRAYERFKTCRVKGRISMRFREVGEERIH